MIGRMLARIRSYTINKGEADNFLKQFQAVTMPLHQKVGMPIVATRVDRGQNEFIWVRRRWSTSAAESG